MSLFKTSETYFTFKKVKKYFEDHDCELLETEYIGSQTKMKYRCSCGNEKYKITFSSFKQGHRCRKCSGCEKYTYEEVKKYFEDHDCELYETEYINNSTLMEYDYLYTLFLIIHNHVL